MKRTWKTAAPLIFAFFAAGVCAAKELNAFKLSDISTADFSGPEVSSAPAPVKDWTVIVYMNGKSNVEPFALRDMNRLEAAGSSDRVNVVVELGRLGQKGEGNWSGARRYYVVKDADAEKINSPVLAELPKIDMGDYKEAAAFAKWAKTNFPAKHYLFLVWDHGWGWLDPKPSWKKSISHDFETGHYIKTSQLQDMMRGVGKVDVYASMACFMQMAEVAWEIKDYADVIVGSEEVIQLHSFDFAAIINRLAAAPKTDAEGVGRIFTETFRELYSSPEIAGELEQAKYGVQLSAIRGSALRGLAMLLDGWTELARLADASALKAAKDQVLRMEVGDETTDPQKKISFYADLADFVNLVGKNSPDSGVMTPALRLAGETLENYISQAVVIDSVYVGKDRAGIDYSRTRGISVNLPGQPGNLIDIANNYGDLSFSQDTGWDEFCAWLSQIQ